MPGEVTGGSAALIASLQAVGTIMAEADDPWWVIASAAVVLHGADIGQVADVDVLLSRADAMRILPSIGVEPRRGSVDATFRSNIFGRWLGTAMPVEFMADFCHLSGSEWLRVQPATRQAFDVNGTTVFAPGKAELQEMLTSFGRPKDLKRAARLATVV